MANVDSIISEFELKVADLRRQLELAEAELRGMKTLRDSMLANAHGTTHQLLPDTGHKGGRQPGAISQTWRHILSDIYWTHQMLGGAMSVLDILNIAKRCGLSLRPSDVEGRMQHYSNFNYVAQTPFGYKVTDVAAKRFGFASEPLKSSASGNVSTEAVKNHSEPGDQTGTV